MKVGLFYEPQGENGFLSNWYMSNITYNGFNYCCATQLIVELKAMCFKDYNAIQKIRNTFSPREMIDIGRNIKGFDKSVWDANKELFAYIAISEKFKQNQDLLEKLKDYDCFAYSDSRDLVWGTGIDRYNNDASNVSKWCGDNLLGKIIADVKEELCND